MHNRSEISTTLKSSAARRDIPIPPALVGCLASLKQTAAGDCVICDAAGDPWSMTAYRNAWRYIMRRQTGMAKRTERGETVRNSKVQITIDFDVTPHIFRHTYITNPILSGANIKVMQYLAGHSKAEVTLNIYAHHIERSPEANLNTVLQAFPAAEKYPQKHPQTPLQTTDNRIFNPSQRAV